MNILQTITEQLSPDLLGQISKSVGESPESVKSSLTSGIMPALLGSAVSQASSPGGATSLFNLVKERFSSGSSTAAALPTNLTGDHEGVGASMVNTLLGSKTNMIRDFIASRSGIRSQSASSLLGVGGQLLMAVLGKSFLGGASASNFGQLLRSQIPHLQGVIPNELTNMLGIGNLLRTGSTATAPAAYAETHIDEPARAGVRATPSMMRWAVIPLALLLGLLYLGYRHNRQENVGGTTDDSLSSRSVGTVASPSYQTPAVGTTMASQLKRVFDGSETTPINLDGLSFDSSGKLTAAAKSSLSTLVGAINDHPSTRLAVTVYGPTAEEAQKKPPAGQVLSNRSSSGRGFRRIGSRLSLR
jgi:hypothetical protein